MKKDNIFSKKLENIINKIDKKIDKKIKKKNGNKKSVNISDMFRRTTRSLKLPLCSSLKFFNKKKENLTWVAATHLKNYMTNDHIVDWFRYNQEQIPVFSHKSKTTFDNFLLEKGVEFERYVIKYLSNKLKNKLSKYPEEFIHTVSEFHNANSVDEVKRMIYSGFPIIHSAPLTNTKNNTGGVADIIIRSDYINMLVDIPVIEDNLQSYKAPKLRGNYHYLVIDIKYTTIPLRSDAIHILNSGYFPAYKSQLKIYNDAIGEIQGYTSPTAYILGRRSCFTKNGEYTIDYTFDRRLGVVDFSGIDIEFNSKTEKAISWVRDVRKNGNKWCISPPSREELYPNMKVKSGKWYVKKEEIARNIGEITMLWYCGLRNRNLAFAAGVYSWKDARCCSGILGFSGQKGDIIDKMIMINRGDVNYNIYPQKIDDKLLRQKMQQNGCYDMWKHWRNDKDDDLYVDFETFGDMFANTEYMRKGRNMENMKSRNMESMNTSHQERTDMIFMIGIYYSQKNCLGYKSYKYKSFIIEKNDLKSELKILKDFYKFVKDRKFPRIYYWSAEKNLWEKALERHSHKDNSYKYIKKMWRPFDFKDLCDFFKQVPIVIKGSFGFGLKEISRCMREHGMIKSHIKSECDSGLTAMAKAWQCYTYEKNPSKTDTIKDIEKYNKFDCKVLWEILRYLRKNL